MTATRDVGERAFRALLRLYPRAFRERFLDEMLDFFRARRDEQRHRRGGRGIARLWLHLVADIAINAPLQHLRALRPRSVTAHDLPWASPEYPPETHPMDTLRQDLRYAFRTLFRHPAFAIVAGLTLALGIGANTAIFSVVDAVLLRPLPWPDNDRLVVVYGTRAENRQGGVAYLDFRDWREQSKSFEELGVIRGQSVNLTGRETPDRVIGSFVTASTFRMLGASSLQGRLFTDAETEVATKEPVAVVNESAWRSRFGSSPDLVGSALVLNGQPFTVVGIMRPGFEQPLGTPDVWLPLGYYPNRGDLETRGRGGVLVFGKLRSDIPVERAQSDLDAITSRLAALYPATNSGVGANVSPLREEIVGDARTPLLVVLAAVATVLLIACANVANLQLARATARRRELSVRAALGAARTRIMRQLLTESLVLSLAGGLAGLAVAHLGVQWLAAVVPNQIVIFGDISLSRTVLIFAGLLTLGTGIIFGIAPAWQASRSQLQETLTVRGDSGVVRLGARSALVVGQIALCVVLLVSAGLLTRSLIAITRVQPGFDADRLLTLQFRLPPTTYDSEAKIANMFTRTVGEIRAVPGVERAALARATPLNGNGETVTYALQGSDITDAAKLPSAHRNIVSPEYFETMRIPRLEGRDFSDADRLGAAPVVIVNEQLARKVAPEGSALGRQVRVSFADAPVWATIVGVVGNAKHFRLSETQLDQVYMPSSQLPLIFTEVVVRTTAPDPMNAANAVRGAIWRVDRDQPVWRVRPVTQSIEAQLGSRKFIMRLLASFAILAVILAMIGVYGVMSYAVARRTQEMGIRMALGARSRQVVTMVLRQGMRTIAIAVALGLVAAFLATRVLESQLFGIASTDPLTFAAVTVALAAIALLACYLPARRASKVDPVVALRAD
jgi:putative ABC transport system permease protein